MAIYTVNIWNNDVHVNTLTVDTDTTFEGMDICVRQEGISISSIENDSATMIFYVSSLGYTEPDYKFAGLSTLPGLDIPSYPVGTGSLSLNNYATSGWIDLETEFPDTRTVDLWISVNRRIIGGYYPKSLGATVSSIASRNSDLRFYMNDVLYTSLKVNYETSVDVENGDPTAGFTVYAYPSDTLIEPIHLFNVALDGRLVWISSTANDMWFLEEDQYISISLFDTINEICSDVTIWYTISVKSTDGVELGRIEDFAKDTSSAGRVEMRLTSSGVSIIHGDPNKTTEVLYQHTDPRKFIGLSTSSSSGEVEYSISETYYFYGDIVDELGKGEMVLYVCLGESYNYYMIRLETLQSIVEAIRLKTGKTGKIKVKDFASEILSLPITISGKWKFNDEIGYTDEVHFEGVYGSSTITIDWDATHGNLSIDIPNVISEQVYVDTAGGWMNEDYKSIDFGDTPQSTNANFVLFMEANATRVETSSSSSSSITYITDDEIDDLINSIEV